MNRSTDLYVDGKRRILVADDEMINRELLNNILCDEYDVLMAEDGEMAYEVIRQNRNTLSLILLDLMMPKLNGLDLLSRLKETPDLKGIPVIVLTSDQASEVESLVRGAADFIPKPYPQPDVIRARISRSIELAEDRQIISATERDELTGLYSYEYFSRYAEQFDKYHPNDWRKRLGVSVPVSVNLSRAEMYDPALVDTFEKITSETGTTAKDIYLEITESAYVRDADQIVDRVKELRDHGFFIEMDDFGSGYSSLNMISELPIDALKLDMMFIRNAFDKQNDTRMISIVIDIADCLGVPVIAEGVETEEQYLALKKLGCTIIQGYYFSKPVPAEEFEKFLVENNA